MLMGPTPGGLRNGTPPAGRWGVNLVEAGCKIFRLKLTTPVHPLHGSFHRRAGRSGWVNIEGSTSRVQNFASQYSHPPARHGSFHPLKDDGGGVNDRKDLDQPKKYGFRYSTPPRPEETGLR